MFNNISVYSIALFLHIVGTLGLFMALGNEPVAPDPISIVEQGRRMKRSSILARTREHWRQKWR